MSGVTPPDLRDVFDPGRERRARLARRFYEEVTVRPDDRGHAVLLDDRELKSPARSALRLPTAAAAGLLAAEWQAQDDRIDPATMPVTRMVWTGLDRIAPDPAPAVAELVGFAGSDLVCYRADAPADLSARQAAAWDPLLDWLAAETGARLSVTSGIVHVAQDAAALQRLEAGLDGMAPVRMAALHTAVVLTGSFVIGLALERGHLEVPAAWAAARIDETFQEEQWGVDREAEARAAGRVGELQSAAALLRALD